MRNHTFTLLVSSFLILILSIHGVMSQDSPDFDYTQIGVEDGDSFNFTLLRFNLPFGGLPFDLGAGQENAPQIEFEEGDEFSITVKNATPTLDAAGNYTLPVMIDNGEETMNRTIPLIFGSLIVFTDWEYWEENMKEQVSANLISTDEPPKFEVINGPEIFNATLEFDDEFSFFGSPTQFHITNEMHYNKTTGVLLYSATLIEVGMDDGINVVEIIIAQNGYLDFDLPTRVITETSTDDSSPGFGVLLAFSSLITIITLRSRNKNNRSKQ